MENEIKYKSFTILTGLEKENYHESPREWDNEGKMVCFHNSMNLPNELDLSHHDFDNRDILWEHLEESYDLVLPIYMLDHSGVTISTSKFSCNRDSWQIWFICGNIDSNWLNKTQLTKQLECEVKDYDRRIKWEYYEFEIKELEEFCGGFDNEETALAEAKHTIDSSKINIYEYEIGVRGTRKVKIIAKSVDEAEDKLTQEDYEIITETGMELLSTTLLSTNIKYESTD